MSRRPSSFRGHPSGWVFIPLLAVGMVTVWMALRWLKTADGPVAVTALKPVAAAGDDEGEQGSGSAAAGDPEGMPIEVRYGVPSPRTARLWSEPRPG